MSGNWRFFGQFICGASFLDGFQIMNKAGDSRSRWRIIILIRSD
jgi:hypothetical protein